MVNAGGRERIESRNIKRRALPRTPIRLTLDCD
jgi:hypothetical protein